MASFYGFAHRMAQPGASRPCPDASIPGRLALCGYCSNRPRQAHSPSAGFEM